MLADQFGPAPQPTVRIVRHGQRSQCSEQCPWAGFDGLDGGEEEVARGDDLGVRHVGGGCSEPGDGTVLPGFENLIAT